MAQIIEFRAATGRALTAKVFLPGSDTVVQTASAVVEATNRLGTYAATFTGLALAEYEIIGFSAGVPVARWLADVAANNGVFETYEKPATYWSKTRAEYLDSVLLAESAQRTVSVTGSHHVAADVHAFQPDVITAAAIASDAVTEIQSGLATFANQVSILDRQGYALAVLAGTISDAQTAAETYQIAIGGSTYAVDFSGLDAAGNRAGQTLAKT